MRKWAAIIKISVWVTACVLFACASPSHAQQAGTEATEVYLTFRYRGIVNVYVTSYYKDNQFYLPVSELFNALQIQHQVDQGALTISGKYLGEKEYRFDFKNQVARAGDTEIQLQADDFIIPGIDYFVTPSIFEELFGLTFTTNFNNLTLDLQTEDRLPVVAQYEREQERQQLDRDKPLYDRTFYPLKYDREYGTVDGGFLDYNLSAIYTGGTPLFTFSNAIGAEILAGDLQGNLFGALSRQQQSFTTSGLRWRYVQRNNSYFSSAIVGQTNSEGFGNRAFRGVKISNKPVEPRQLFDRYVIDGNTTPQSEVELYLNNSLVDFQEADESGNYRFVVPLTYGSTNYSLRIYTPSGQAIERNNRIQVPFDYIPKGEVDYSISAGELSNPILGFSDTGYMADASVSAGLSNWLTAQASTEYLTQFHNTIPSFTGTLNARLFTNYLLSASANSENFYRLSSSVVYSSGASWSLSYDYNPGQSRLYNVGGSDHQARLNLFTPFKIGNTPLNIRWSSTYRQNASSSLLRYRADLSTRLNRLNVRFGYQDQQSGALSFITTQSSRITNSYTYSVGRSGDIPGLLRQMFIRGNISYLPGLHEFEEVEFQLSRNIFGTGRFQLTFGHNFLGDFNSVGLNVTIDFDKFRSNSSATSNGSQMSFTQNIRGSVGYDGYGEQLILNNRQQVGQAGTAVRLFLDNNNDGSYQKDTDELIRDPAVRLNRSGGRTQVQNGINYISQLLPYYRYDIEINKNELSNPLLVPDSENFSIVTDPNQFKPIEIPFYLSGVISGRVERLRIDGQDSTRSGLSGVRLFLESDYENPESREAHSEEIRTFSDGSFYTYEVPPGKYNLFIDPNQLNFLDGVPKPDTMNIEVKPLPEGDFIENLIFTVAPKQDKTETDTTRRKVASIRQEDTNRFKVQIGSFKYYENAIKAVGIAQHLFDQTFCIQFNPKTQLNAVRSMPITGLENAAELLEQIRHKSEFKDPALVVMEEKDRLFSVQLGAFSTVTRAKRFFTDINNRLDLELYYYKDPIDKLYKVRTEGTSDRMLAKKKLDKLRSTSEFHDAFIPEDTNFLFEGTNYSFQLRISGISGERQITIPEDVSSEQLVNGPQKDMITLQGFTKWKELLSIQDKIRKLKPGIEPVIILQTKAAP
ncbi:SPOR domain-containing protein [Aliifodinibius sp. S!AR15-10]|uniref:SPOR domain-containing protein n=1 Tax=Aliifodinibius sp. S!AR15-10 TaxID=2950437 RepID=UPI0028647CEB|nr:SPOR domain-containing protein [Aliifodinibius sp. S!AR15-10]MDR8390860.1 SPOR domain-containing protein [Aliifodinibius sp. S!AR15-10]